MNKTITNFIILINILCFLKLDPLTKKLTKYCIFNANQIVQNKDYLRCIVPHFYHINIGHILVNMINFNTISNKLESIYSKRYQIIILLSVLLTSFFHVLVSYLFKRFYNYHIFYYQNSLGFSGVIFSLKTIYYYILNRELLIYNFRIHSRYMVWLDLLIASILLPNASFIGHLSGILAGHTIFNYF